MLVLPVLSCPKTSTLLISECLLRIWLSAYTMFLSMPKRRFLLFWQFWNVFLFCLCFCLLLLQLVHFRFLMNISWVLNISSLCDPKCMFGQFHLYCMLRYLLYLCLVTGPCFVWKQGFVLFKLQLGLSIRYHSFLPKSYAVKYNLLLLATLE